MEICRMVAEALKCKGKFVADLLLKLQTSHKTDFVPHPKSIAGHHGEMVCRETGQENFNTLASSGLTTSPCFFDYLDLLLGRLHLRPLPSSLPDSLSASRFVQPPNLDRNFTGTSPCGLSDTAREPASRRLRLTSSHFFPRLITFFNLPTPEITCQLAAHSKSHSTSLPAGTHGFITSMYRGPASQR